jgi:antitoxin CptB
MSEFDRFRWRCRRGLLELDLVFSRFLATRFEDLTEQQRHCFAGLLELPDNDLWDMVVGRQEAPDPRSAEIIGYLR